MWLLLHAFYIIIMCKVHGDAFNDAWLETSDNSSQPPTIACHSSTSNGPKRVVML